MTRLLPLALLLGSTAASAQTAAFDSAVNQIMSGLTNVSALTTGYDARITALEAENSLPGAEASFAYKWPQQRGVENRWGVEVSQSFDWPGTYGARRNAAAQLRRLKGLEADALQDALRYEVENTLLELIEARQRREILAEATANLDEVVAKTRTLLTRGQVTVLDLQKAEFELLSMREKLAQAEADCQRLRLSAGFGQVIPEAIDSLTEFPEKLSPIPFLTPEQADLMAEAISGSADARIEQMKRFPGFSLGYLHDFEEGVHFNGLSVGINLPAYRAGKAATAARLQAETAELKLKEATAARGAQLQSMADEAARLDTLLAQYDNVLADSDFPRLLRKSLDAGQITLTQYLLDQTWHLTTRLDHLNLRLRRSLLR